MNKFRRHCAKPFLEQGRCHYGVQILLRRFPHSTHFFLITFHFTYFVIPAIFVSCVSYSEPRDSDLCLRPGTRRKMCLITPPLSGNSSPTENSTPGPLSPMQPYQKSSLRMARLQRKARLQLNRHSYTDEEMRAILQEMWKSQDNCKLLRGNPEFVAKYVKAGLVSKEEEAVLLRDRVHFNLCTRLSSQEGSV